ncbi:hypothetical protein [Emcibacter sp.]|uniref:hypothetical protein n=1 Tax=Emcibacter sp. TaxID=1979954 RepID=UPI002AA763A0|nr:hypothetical protein [Emcibacter sp.]
MIEATASAVGATSATPTTRNGQEVALHAKKSEDAFDNLVAEFLKWSKMNPVERIRAQYLKDNGLTEESLAALPAKKQEAIEKEIQELIEEQLAFGDDTDQELEQMKEARFGDQALEHLLTMQSLLLQYQDSSGS